MKTGDKTEWPLVGPREADVLRLLDRAQLTRRQIADLLGFTGASSTLSRLEEKGLVDRTMGPWFFDGDLWRITVEGMRWLGAHPEAYADPLIK